MRKPFIKFICHSASYFTFLCKCSNFCFEFINIDNRKTNGITFIYLLIYSLYHFCNSDSNASILNICECSLRFQSSNDRNPFTMMTTMTSTYDDDYFGLFAMHKINIQHIIITQSFTVLLMLASQRIESVLGNWIWFWGGDANAAQNQSTVEIEIPTIMNQKRGATPSAIEWMILAWVSGKLFYISRPPCTMSYFFFFSSIHSI